jgi:hypothetical protein
MPQPPSIPEQSENNTNMDDTEIAHLAGVMDAIGRVTVTVGKREENKLNYKINPKVSIMRPQEDSLMMGKFLTYMDNQGVRYGDEEIEREKAYDARRITVKQTKSAERFLEPLVPYLVTKHEIAVFMLERFLPRMKRGDHLEKQSFYELVGMADAIRGANNDREHKYDQEHFAELWDLPE